MLLAVRFGVAFVVRFVLTGPATVALVGVLEGLTSGLRDPLLAQAEPLLALPDGMASRVEGQESEQPPVRGDEIYYRQMAETEARTTTADCEQTGPPWVGLPHPRTPIDRSWEEASAPPCSREI